MRQLLKGGIFGGLLLFGWNALSWMVLPWHALTLSRFKNEAPVLQALRENAPDPGLYVTPSPTAEGGGTARGAPGPRVFLAYAPRGEEAPLKSLALSLGLHMLGALLLTILLRQASGLGFLGRVLFVELAVVTAGVLVVLPQWNWWQFPLGHTLATLGDLAAGGLAAALALAWITRP